MGAGVVFRRIGGRIIPITLRNGTELTSRGIGGAMELAKVNNSSVRSALAKKIVETRKFLRSGELGSFAQIDIAPALKGVRKNASLDKVNRLVFRPFEALKGSPMYKQLGRGGPVDLRLQLQRKGLPKIGFVNANIEKTNIFKFIKKVK